MSVTPLNLTCVLLQNQLKELSLERQVEVLLQVVTQQQTQHEHRIKSMENTLSAWNVEQLVSQANSKHTKSLKGLVNTAASSLEVLMAFSETLRVSLNTPPSVEKGDKS